jgi:hypothetical protein
MAALASHPFPSEEYNVALEAITRMFTDQDPGSTRVSHSNVLQLRTNDFLLSGFTRWELRQFQLSPTTGFFDQVTVKETPDGSFNGTQTFADASKWRRSSVGRAGRGSAPAHRCDRVPGSGLAPGRMRHLKSPHERGHDPRATSAAPRPPRPWKRRVSERGWKRRVSERGPVTRTLHLGQ